MEFIMNYDIKKNTLTECLEYWKNPDEHNLPSTYNTERTIERSKYLVELFEKNFDKSNKILELGCNCGRNLNYLNNAGYKKLTGIEINKSALEQKKIFFPNLKGRYINKSLEDAVLTLKDNQFDIVFSMAVIQHISLESNWIFEDLTRIAKKYIVLIELDLYRNYESILQTFNFKLIEKQDCTKLNITGLKKYKTRIFEKIM